MDRDNDKTSLNLDGNEYVVLPRAEYDRLSGLARVASLPPLPAPDADGNYPAAAFMRASMARKLATERARLGLSQRDLADLAGLRVETISRLETGKHTVSTPTAGKIAAALRKAHARSRRKPARRG
ncbi:MAG: helix-turn-helix transcriptional regulator [Phycisphaerales bacterium]